MLTEEECVLESVAMDSVWSDVCLDFTAEAPSWKTELR